MPVIFTAFGKHIQPNWAQIPEIYVQITQYAEYKSDYPSKKKFFNKNLDF